MFRSTIFAFLFASCLSAAEPPQSPTPTEQVLRDAAISSVPVIVENAESKWKSDVQKETLRFLRAQDYAALDALAASLRASKACFEDGFWKLNFFYSELSDCPDKATQSEWEARLQLINNWFEKDTNSIAARIAYARALISDAWRVRGEGWASSVSKEGWDAVEKRSAEARAILQAAHELPEKCPGWYTAWMQVALAAQVPREEYERVFAESVRFYPDYRTAYFSKVYYLQTRWYGTPGEWEMFAANSADHFGGEEGDIFYAQIFWFIHDIRLFGNPVAETRVEWPRVRRGFEAMRRRNPNSIQVLSEYCSLAGFAPTGARGLMRSLFLEVGNRVDLSVWKELELFKRARLWAFAQR